MLLNETRPLLLGSNVRDENSIQSVDLTNPDICLDRRLVLPKTCCTSCARYFCGGMAYQSLLVQNHGNCPFGVRLSFAFAGDFADLFEVRGLRRKRRSTCKWRHPERPALRWPTRGLDGIVRRTTLLFDPAPENSPAWLPPTHSSFSPMNQERSM
jgi:glycogen debranching enzyme